MPVISGSSSPWAGSRWGPGRGVCACACRWCYGPCQCRSTM